MYTVGARDIAGRIAIDALQTVVIPAKAGIQYAAAVQFNQGSLGYWMARSSGAKTREACQRAAPCADPLALLPDDNNSKWDAAYEDATLLPHAPLRN